MPLAFSCAFILFIDTEFSCTKEAYRPWTSKSFFYHRNRILPILLFPSKVWDLRYMRKRTLFECQCIKHAITSWVHNSYVFPGDWIRAISSWSYEPLNGLAIHKAAKAPSSICSYFKAEYWSAAGSNLRPPTPQSSALPTELILQWYIYNQFIGYFNIAWVPEACHARCPRCPVSIKSAI